MKRNTFPGTKRLQLQSCSFLTLLLAFTASMPCHPVCAEEKIIQNYSNIGFAMETVLSESIYTTGEDITPILTELFEQIDTDWLSWTLDTSQISKVNAENGNPVSLIPELSSYLKEILDLCEKSEGALEITLGDIIRLWGIDGPAPQIPPESELQNLLKYVGYEKIKLTDTEMEAGTEITLPKGTHLDLGGVGKGIACDEALKYLKEQPEVEAAIINLGGSSVMTYGTKPDDSPWKVAVIDPRDTQGEYLGVVELRADEFLSTSGDYEKFFIENDIRYHHILNPMDGYPVQNGITAVTVVCENGTLADGLSTACFVLGKDSSEKLLEYYHADGMFVTEAGEIFLTPGMDSRFELLKNTYTICEK